MLSCPYVTIYLAWGHMAAVETIRILVHHTCVCWARAAASAFGRCHAAVDCLANVIGGFLCFCPFTGPDSFSRPVDGERSRVKTEWDEATCPTLLKTFVWRVLSRAGRDTWHQLPTLYTVCRLTHDVRYAVTRKSLGKKTWRTKIC